MLGGGAEADAGGRLERDLAGVDGVVGAVVAGNLHVDHGVAGQDALGEGLLDALVHCGDVLARNLAAHDLVEELIAAAGVGLEAQPAVAELAGAARLLLVAALGAGSLANGLTVGDAQGLEDGLDAGALGQAVHHDAYLGLAHGAHHGLVRLLVARDADGGVGVAGLLKEGAELVFLVAVLGADGHLVERVGEAEGLSLDLAGGAQGVAGVDLELGHHDDVAGQGLLDVGGLTAAHEVEVTQALGGLGARADELHAGLERAGKHLEEGQTARLGVV